MDNEQKILATSKNSHGQFGSPSRAFRRGRIRSVMAQYSLTVLTYYPCSLIACLVPSLVVWSGS